MEKKATSPTKAKRKTEAENDHTPSLRGKHETEMRAYVSVTLVLGKQRAHCRVGCRNEGRETSKFKKKEKKKAVNPEKVNVMKKITSQSSLIVE